jgi:hypothetical protein
LTSFRGTCDAFLRLVTRAQFRPESRIQLFVHGVPSQGSVNLRSWTIATVAQSGASAIDCWQLDRKTRFGEVPGRLPRLKIRKSKDCDNSSWSRG